MRVPLDMKARSNAVARDENSPLIGCFARRRIRCVCLLLGNLVIAKKPNSIRLGPKKLLPLNSFSLALLLRASGALLLLILCSKKKSSVSGPSHLIQNNTTARTQSVRSESNETPRCLSCHLFVNHESISLTKQERTVFSILVK